jgi:RND family efflux transporter MFP subunit
MRAAEPEPRRDLSALRIHRAEEEERRSFPFLKLLVWLIILGALGAGGWLGWKRWGEPRSYPVVQTMTVKPTVRTRSESLLTATGYLVADRQAEITPKVSGRIVQLPFQNGSNVRQGDVLAVLEASELQAQLRAAEAGHAEAVREYQRQKTLWAEGVTSRALYDAAETQLNVTAARRDQVRVLLRDTVIHAPFGGRIIAKHAELGEVVSPPMGAGASRASGSSIATIADLSTLELEADVNESNVGGLRAGQPAEVTVDAFRGQRWKGELRQILPTADRAKGIVKVKVRILDPSERLLPEMSASVAFLQQERTAEELTEKPKIWIPAAAVLTDPAGSRVRIVDASKRLRYRPVTVGQRREGRIEIIAGLRDGDVIITGSDTPLEEGQPVQLEEEPPA